MTLRLQDVSKYVGQEMHLEGVDLTLEPGSRNVILGRTLAGKTSLLRILAGLDRPRSGKVLSGDTDLTGVSVRKRSVAMVYQQFINYPSQTVYRNIASPLQVMGMKKGEIDERVRRTAQMLHLTDLLDRLPAELSGGQQQRTAIARALVKKVDLLLLDEPLVNLDYKLREELREELVNIFERREAIVVYTTTEPTEALQLGGNIIVMDEGRVLQTGPTAEVYSAPATTRVAEVFSDPPINFVRAIVSGGKASLRIGIDFPLAGHLEGLPEGEYTFGVRSNHLFLEPRAAGEVCIKTTVELAEINGSETFVHFFYRNRSLVAQEEGVRSYKVGSEVAIHVHPDHFFVYDLEGNLLRAAERLTPDN